MNSGDMVYYLHTNQQGQSTKFAAQVIDTEADGVRIRVGKFNTDTKEIKTLETVVSTDKLLPRSVPCSYESELAGQD